MSELGKFDRLNEIADYHRKVATFHTDGYYNMLNKVGTMQDNSTAWNFKAPGVDSDAELTKLYTYNGLFAKIINRPAEDAIAKGIDLSDLGVDLELNVKKRLTALHWGDQMAKAEKWSRLYGGSIVVMIVNDGRGLEEPLDWKRATKIEELHTFERAVVQPDYSSVFPYTFYNLNEDKERPFGQPEFYYVYSQFGQFKVHYTRCLIFKNGNLPELIMNGMYQFWGLPVYTQIKDSLREVITAHHDGTKLLERSTLGVYKMKNLANLLSTDEGENKVIKRLQVIDMARNIMNSMAIDGDGEDYQYINASMAGASDLIDRTCNMLSAVTDIPQTILFGRSPAGMDATGDGDMDNYYMLLGRIQKQNLKDNTEKLVKLILLQMAHEGEIDKNLPEYEVKFYPFKQISEKEQADIESTKATTEKTKADTAQLYVDMQALDPSEIRKKLSESDSYQIQGIVDPDEVDMVPQGEEMPPEDMPTETPEKPDDIPVIPK